MAKGKKQRKQGQDSDSEQELDNVEEIETTPVEPAAGGKKGKKDRKKKKEAELEEVEKELEAIAAGEEPIAEVKIEDEDGSKDTKSKKKKDKKKKNKVDTPVDSDDEAEEIEAKPVVKKAGFAAFQMDDSEDNQDSDEEAPVITKAPEPEKKNKKAKKKEEKKSGFAAFQMDDSDEDLANDSDEAPVITKAPEPKKKNKKGKKNDEKDDDNNDENMTEAAPAEGKKDKKKKKKNKKDDDEDELDKALADLKIEVNVDDDAAAKKKAKKERKKLKQQDEPASKEDTPAPNEAPAEATEEEATTKKGKKEKAKKEEEKKGKKPGNKKLLAMQEALKEAQELQEKAIREAEEQLRKEEEAEREREEKERLEKEKKELKKQREREKKEQLRKEGKLLTAKQRADKARAEQMLASMRAQGIDVPETGVKRGPRPGTRIRNKNKAKSETPETDKESSPATEPETKVEEPVTEKTEKKDATETPEAPEAPEEEDVLDSWDAEPEEPEEKVEEAKEEVKEKDTKDKDTKDKTTPDKDGKTKEAAQEESSDDSEDESESDDDDDDDDDSESDSESDEEQTEQTKRERAIARIAKRKADHEAKRTTDDLRAPVVVVMGHVDTGKTKILDKLRRTNVQDGEAGGITQQIGATNVPIEVVHEQCKMVNGYDKEKVKLPGLLIIDTPGHESFSNLRDRGSSLCDIAILVVDIMHCLEPQTIESINLLKKKKVPFVIALNKIDRLYEWKPNRHKDVKDTLASQPSNTTRMEFEKRSKEVITAIAEQGLNCALFYENPDPREYISMIPTSAHSGDGMGNLMSMLVTLSQSMLAKRLSYSNELQATVLEVKAIPGLGTTIDIVLLNGKLKEGQTMVVAGTEGPIVTTIRSLLTPAKMQDLRVKNNYLEHKEIQAAQGVKIAAKELEKTVAGLNLLVANHPDEVELCREEMEKRLESVLRSFKLKDRGVFVQASTLGSLEALLDFLKESKIPFAGVKIGPVVKRDVMKASVMLEHEPKYTIILAFDVKIERDAQELADREGVKIFQADIIYHLFDRFTQYQEELKKQKREEFKHVAVFPCKFKVLPNFVFNSRDPIVAGIVVDAGVIRTGTPICVPSKDFIQVGILTSIQVNNKEVETARKGDEVCVKIEPTPGEAPKMFGRHFDETDVLMSKISRASIDACKDYFREDLQKSDWALMVELKKLFEIL